MIQGQVLVTWTQADINLLERAQQPDHGKNVFENMVRIYIFKS
jgi:hypothetical protein